MIGKQSKKVFTLVVSISLMVLIIMTVSLTACTKAQPTPTPPVSTPTPPSAKPITLVFSTQELLGGIWEEFYKGWFAELEKSTGGRVKVEDHWAGELVNVADVYARTADGTVDMAHFMPLLVPGKFPMDEIITLPPLDSFCWNPDRVYWELFQTFPEMEAQYKNVKVLWLGTNFFCGIGTVKKPIRKLEDNKGLKMLGGGKWITARGEALGWTPVALPPQDVYMAYQTGVLDGGTVAMTGLFDYKWVDHIHYITMVNATRVPFGCFMNLNKWNSLPADVQKIMKDMSEELVDRHNKLAARLHETGKARASKEFGVEFIELPSGDVSRWVEANKPVIERFTSDLTAKGLPGSKFVEEYSRLDKKYAAPEYAPK